MESLEENLSQVKQSLIELENLYKDGKDQHDATVKATEETIRLALNIPRENWINTGQPLKVLVESLQRQLDILQSPSYSIEMISDKDVMKNASGGLALEGIYKTSNLEDLLEKREQLIAIPESLSLTSPKQDSMYEQKEFSSYKSQSVYEKVIQNLGFSLSTSLKIGYGSFSLGSAVDVNKLSEKEDTHTNSHEESYILQTKYNYIPLACCFIDKEMLLLSDGAINALKEIEMLILHSNKSKTLRNKVKDFYERFGSHVNQGPIHFGGIFWWRAFAAGFSSSDLSEMKKLTSDALNAYIGAGYGVPFINFSGTGTTSQLTGSFTGKHKETLISQVQLSVSKTGGPAEVDNHLQWKYHLATSNKTWSVIDRGMTLIPIWEILTATHKDDFTDAFNLSRILMETYTDITKLNVEQVLEEDLCEVKKAKMLIQSVKNWSASECESHLTTLLKLKTRLLQKTGSHNTWILVCLSDQILQNYLLEVTTINKSSKILIILMQNLLEPDLCKVENFSNRSKIMNWIYQKEDDKDISVSEFSELCNRLQHAKKELEDSRYALSFVEEDFSAKKNATSTATVSLNSWCKTLRENDQKETELLILSIATVLGYNTEVKTFDHVLDLNEINFLLTKLQDAFSRYSCLKEQCATRAQAYLFLTALTLSNDEDIQISNKEKRLQLIQTQLQDNISFAIKSAIENSQDNWQLLEEALYSIEMGTHNSDEHPMLEESVFHLENVLPKQLPSVSEIEHAGELNTSGNNTAGVKMDSFMHLLEKLGLSGSYPKKMTKKDVLVISSLSLSINEPTTEKELSNLYLYKLMTLDYQARYLCVKPEAGSMSLNDSGVIAEDDEDFFDVGDKSIQSVSSKKEQIHPMDIHMAIFHCSNDFLRQYIFTKLSASQFGLPILVPSPCTEEVEFPLWALRHISRSWQSKNGWTSGKYNDRQMFNTPVPTVSFIRLGSSNYNSKSQILNGVISKQRHSVFFHRHCRGSTSNSLLMNGVAEIAWYCPGGKGDDIFDDCVAFLNLHGDAAEHPKQLEFIQAVSTVNVLLLSEHAMSEAAKKISQELCKHPAPLICLFSGKEHIQQSKNPRMVRIAAKNRNQAELTDELTSQIKQCICLNKQTTSLEGCSTAARKLQFKVDEDNKSCQDAYSQATKLTCLLKKGNVPTLKERFLPLQGELWHDWCIKDKQQYRLRVKERESLEQQLSRISAEMTCIRLRQLETPLNEFMRLFLECLTSSVNPEDTILYKLQWLRILLDGISTEALAELEEDYLSTWRKMRVQKDKEKATRVQQMQSKLNSICDKMVTATVGLQHLMREVGQLYEANQMTAKGKENTKQYSSSLPDIGVKMLLSGYPLELMDGDTAHVPVKWIKAVLEKLIETCGDKKLFVLSILGLQSSGKSTLLNTMFGVQFSVSAGRCTRGAFMQLIPVDFSIRNQLGYDFVLIVDTEGLRSPELSTKQSVSHDNELATFVIGIGDMTVINIMGENASEMHDILQICVQAFLRMKRVKISPGCIFVHQNCSEASAGEKNMEWRRRLLQKLDNMATIAAKEENIDGINEFSDVIQFDIESQVFYFKNLLEGDPPMAPPNPSYSQNVQELKTKLLTIAEWKPEHKFSSFSEFRSRVGDLWKSLLQENFVFSFRNEMMVYTSLEEKYAVWTWELRKYALEMQNKLCNQIGRNLIQDVNVPDLIEDFNNQVYNQLQQEIQKYFTEDKHRETLTTWRANIDKRFRNLRTELIDGTVKKCKELITSKNNRSELDHRKIEYTAELTKQSKALASYLKAQRLDDKQVTEEFNKLWVNWTAKVDKAHIPNECVNVKAIVETILLIGFEKQPNVFQKIKDGTGMFVFDEKKHVSLNFIQKITQWRQFSCSENLFSKQVQQEVNHAVTKYVTAKEKSKEDFNESFIYEILATIEMTIAEFEHSTGKLKFTNEFKADLSIHICLKYVSRFQRMQKTFQTSNHPLTYLQSQRGNYLQAFRNYCKGANSVTIFVDFLCKHIKPGVLVAVNDKTSQHIAGKMKSNNPAFNSNRSNLENHIMKHLAIKEDFSSFAEYINFPKRYFERFIQEEMDNFCNDTGKLHMMHEENLGTLKNLILSASTEATREVEDKKGNASMWLDCFCKTLGEHMVIKRNELHTIENEDIEDWQFFKDVMAKSLDEILKDEKAIDMETLRKKPTEYLFNQLQGCWEQCPFCKAICTNTIPNHDGEHSVTFHRCDALAGWHYEGTDHFSINFCTTDVSSDEKLFPRCNENESIPYKTYRKAGDPYNKWNITPDGSVQRYWKWFICKFQKQLEYKYKYKFVGRGAIPNEWQTFTKESVLAELI